MIGDIKWHEMNKRGRFGCERGVEATRGGNRVSLAEMAGGAADIQAIEGMAKREVVAAERPLLRIEPVADLSEVIERGLAEQVVNLWTKQREVAERFDQFGWRYICHARWLPAYPPLPEA